MLFALDGCGLNRQRSLLSQYAWVAEDLTTKDLGRHWIAGGRIKILDRTTGEVLAGRVNFLRVAGPSVKIAWASIVDCSDLRAQYVEGKFVVENDVLFIKHLLRPPMVRSTAAQFQRIKGW